MVQLSSWSLAFKDPLRCKLFFGVFKMFWGTFVIMNTYEENLSISFHLVIAYGHVAFGKPLVSDGGLNPSDRG